MYSSSAKRITFCSTTDHYTKKRAGVKQTGGLCVCCSVTRAVVVVSKNPPLHKSYCVKCVYPPSDRTVRNILVVRHVESISEVDQDKDGRAGWGPGNVQSLRDNKESCPNRGRGLETGLKRIQNGVLGGLVRDLVWSCGLKDFGSKSQETQSVI